MNQKTNGNPVQEAQIVQSPEQETQALIVAETDKLIETTIVELKRSTITEEALTFLEEKYGALIVNGIEDMEGFKLVKSGVSELRTLRNRIEDRRKELTEPALRFQRELKAEADRIVLRIKPLEERLKEEQKRIEDAKEAKRREQYQLRITALHENGFQLINGCFVCGPIQEHSDNITKLTDAQMDVLIKHGQAEIARLAAEEERRKAEAERQRQEQERMNAERAAMEAERAEMARMRAEIEAQKQALQQTYNVVTEPAQPEPSIEFQMPMNQPGFTPPQNIEPMPIQNMDSIQHANVAPEPQKKDPYLHVPKNDFERGFNAFRVELDQLVKNQNIQLSRKTLHEWAWTLPFPKN